MAERPRFELFVGADALVVADISVHLGSSSVMTAEAVGSSGTGHDISVSQMLSRDLAPNLFQPVGAVRRLRESQPLTGSEYLDLTIETMGKEVRDSHSGSLANLDPALDWWEGDLREGAQRMITEGSSDTEIRDVMAKKFGTGRDITLSQAKRYANHAAAFLGLHPDPEEEELPESL